MAKKQASKVGVTFTTGSGKTYSLVSESKVDGQKLYKYKWHECPDPEYLFESFKELDSVDIAVLILKYLATTQIS